MLKVSIYVGNYVYVDHSLRTTRLNFMVGSSIVFSINSIIISFIFQFACNTVIVPIILLSLMSHLTTVDINVVELYIQDLYSTIIISNTCRSQKKRWF